MPKQPIAQLDTFLEARQLDVGIGDYWSASITTVATGGVVTVRPVISTPGGRVVRYERQSAATWYTNQAVRIPRLQHRQAVGRYRRHDGLLDLRPRSQDLRRSAHTGCWCGGIRSSCRARIDQTSESGSSL